MNADPLLFRTIEPAGRSWARWLTSLIIHALAVALLIYLPYSLTRAVVPIRRTPETISLVAPVKLPPPPPIRQVRTPIRPVSRLAPVIPTNVPRPVAHFELPRVPVPVKTVRQPEPVAVEAPRVEAPAIPVARQEIPVAALPAARPEPVVRTGLFEGSGKSSSVDSTSKTVKVGGFAAGVPEGPTGTGGKGMAVRTGGFGDASGVPNGSGTGPAGKPVARAGGFDLPTAAAHAEGKTAARTETPVEILWKPKPLYTDEARGRSVEGEVILDVVFYASGKVEVMRVVRGLGFGLDESARAAAAKIRFRPGLRDGNPVDTRGIVHILFQLS